MRILVAIDGSECADVAIELVAALDWPSGSTIHVVEVVPSGVALFGGPWPPIPPDDTSILDRDIRERATKNLRAAVSRLSRPGRRVETAAVDGRAADIIIELAEQVDADVIVLGSRGHGAIETMLLGSVSSEVVDHAHVPVLVARGRTLERVVYAWDGSARAEAAVGPLGTWGIFAGATIDVLSVADAEPPWWVQAGLIGAEEVAGDYDEAAEPSRLQHEEMAEEMAARLRDTGLDASGVCRIGDPAERIVGFAGEREADLLILGTHGRTGLTRLLMGSVARNVLLHAPCSVLLVR